MTCKVSQGASSNIVYGFHTVLALLKSHADHVEAVFLLKDRQDVRIQTILTLATQHHIPIQRLIRKELEEMLKTQSHQGCALRLKKQIMFSEADLASILEELTVPPFLLVLDHLQDPHNLGACLRSADAASVQAVIIPKDRAADLTPTARKVASGAAEHTPVIRVTNLVRVIRELKKEGIWIVGTADDAEQSVFEGDLTGPLAIVVGREGEGLHHLVRQQCDFLVRIPMQGAVSSLNVSVATGICLFEVARQRSLLK